MSEHTPAPWKWWNYEIVGNPPKQETICKIEKGANARLIAAAPDLLGACRLGLNRLVDLGDNGLWTPANMLLRETKNQMIDAIAKAEGK